MKHIIRFIKSLFGYEYFTYIIEYSTRDRLFFNYWFDGPYQCPLHIMAKMYKLNYRELKDTLIDTCLCGFIYPAGKSYITVEVRRKKFRVVESKSIY